MHAVGLSWYGLHLYRAWCCCPCCLERRTNDQTNTDACNKWSQNVDALQGVPQNWPFPWEIRKAQPIWTSKLTVFREMGSFPWNSVKYCNFVRLLIHFLNIFPMPVLCSAFAITFTQIINNYPLKCNPFSLCLLTVQQSSDVTLI